jgi:hypothetical protein
MIHDLALILRKILNDPGLPEPLKSAQIAFDRPTEPFNPGQRTVNLFLYDVRENVGLRDNEPIIQRQNGQVIIRQPPLRVACSYLVTAWPAGATGEALVLQEHQLLSQALQTLSRYPTISGDLLLGTSFERQEPPLPMMMAQMDGLKNPSEFWTALGNKLRASFSVTVTIAMDVFLPETEPMVDTGIVNLAQQDSPVTGETFRIEGLVTDAGGAPAGNATVTLVEMGLRVRTDAEGRYDLGARLPGNYTLRAQLGAAVRDINIAVPVSAGSNYNVQLP